MTRQELVFCFCYTVGQKISCMYLLQNSRYFKRDDDSLSLNLENWIEIVESVEPSLHVK